MERRKASHPVSRSPAPWSTKSECYWMFLTLRELPQGVYSTLEEPCLGQGDFKGGLGIIIVVRYKDTPVGPYDELMLIPGDFTVPSPDGGPPEIPRKALRICRIYVSQRTTTYNGRLNWNIPKHLARFHFSAPPTPAGKSPPETLDIAVYPPGSEEGDNVRPFFACTLQPFRWIPSMPFSSKWMPMSTMHAQPPIPEAEGHKQAVKSELERESNGNGKIDDYDINPANEEALLAGTEFWRSFPIDMSAPRVRGCWITVHKTTESQGEADSANKYWPQDIRPWTVGAWFEDAVMGIPGPLEWKL
ncbi:hypothetical protein CC80DRAFT_123536 [Byssothecium circinans]|uniref:Uncharacterized protein n=1 Tax=Byssothecium circinans TaxID=147558 RepID=A0A6A5TRQ9_9PLEO|nr:hypothetical protein CC80DRAFT_123536 [Byssothecium circinans]